jgi:hypothetical protein
LTLFELTKNDGMERSRIEWIELEWSGIFHSIV